MEKPFRRISNRKAVLMLLILGVLIVLLLTPFLAMLESLL